MTTRDVWIPRLSLCVAILSILTSTYLQRSAAADQLRSKRFEVTFLEKRNSFVELVRHTSLTLGAMEKLNWYANNDAIPGDSPERKAAYDNWVDRRGDLAIESLRLKPFLDSKGRAWLETELATMHSDWLHQYVTGGPISFFWYGEQQERVRHFGDALFLRLFPKGEPDSPK